MKNLYFVVFFLLSTFVFSQGYRTLTRQGNRALKKQDYATATIKSIQALKQRKDFKKAIVLFQNSIVFVNDWYEHKIEQLEAVSIPYNDPDDVQKTNQIINDLVQLVNVQKELLFFPEGVRLQRNFDLNNYVKDYKPKLEAARNRLFKHQTLAAQAIYEQGLDKFNNAKSKADFQEAYYIFKRVGEYRNGLHNTAALMDICIEKGSYRIAILDPANSSGRTDLRFRVINTIVNNVRTTIGKNLFAIPVSVQNYSMGYYSDNYRAIQADVVIKIIVNDWDYGSNRITKEAYSNEKKRTKKDGTEKVFSVSGNIIEDQYFAYYDVIIEGVSTADNTILYAQPIRMSQEFNNCFLLGEGDSRANDSGCRLVSNLPIPLNIESIFKNDLIAQSNSVITSWFN